MVFGNSKSAEVQNRVFAIRILGASYRATERLLAAVVVEDLAILICQVVKELRHTFVHGPAPAAALRFHP